jgi:hypothetical protein
MDLFGEEFSQEEFDELNTGGGGGDDEDDEFAENDEYFDENDFDGSYEQREDY